MQLNLKYEYTGKQKCMEKKSHKSGQFFAWYLLVRYTKSKPLARSRKVFGDKNFESLK